MTREVKSLIETVEAKSTHDIQETDKWSVSRKDPHIRKKVRTKKWQRELEIYIPRNEFDNFTGE